MWVESLRRRWAPALWTGLLLLASAPAGADAQPAPAPELLEFLGAWSVEDEEWIDALVDAAGARAAEEPVGDGAEHEPEEAIRDGDN